MKTALILIILIGMAAGLVGAFFIGGDVCLWPIGADVGTQCTFKFSLNGDELRIFLGAVALAGLIILIQSRTNDAVSGAGLILLGGAAIAALWPATHNYWGGASESTARGGYEGVMRSAEAGRELNIIQENDGGERIVRYPDKSEDRAAISIQGGYAAVKFRITEEFADRLVLIDVAPEADSQQDPVIELYQITPQNTDNGGEDTKRWTFLDSDDNSGVLRAARLSKTLAAGSYVLGIRLRGDLRTMATSNVILTIEQSSIDSIVNKKADDQEVPENQRFNLSVEGGGENCGERVLACEQATGAIIQAGSFGPKEHKFAVTIDSAGRNVCFQADITTSDLGVNLAGGLANMEDRVVKFEDTAVTRASREDGGQSSEVDAPIPVSFQQSIDGTVDGGKAGFILLVGADTVGTAFALDLQLLNAAECAAGD